MNRFFFVCWLAALALVSAAAASAAPATVQVVIDLRPEITAGRFDPERDRVGIRGAPAPLSWNVSHGAPVQADQPGLYAVTLHFATTPAQPIAYKFKIDRPGQPDEGWEDGRNRSLQLQPGVQTLQRAFNTLTDPLPPQRTGRIERIAPRPSAHVTPREVQVWLPPGYEADAQRRYPVLYLHDGQNVFDAQAAGAEWQVDEVAERLVGSGELPPMIVVAVASTATRVEDYTMVPMQRASSLSLLRGGGQAAAYARYLVQELKPLIDTRYRTRPGRADTAVGGSSLGGLMSMTLALEHGDVFGAALVVSPSVWWADGEIVRRVQQQPAGAPRPRIWLDMGLLEDDGAVAGARRLRDALVAQGWAPAYREEPGAGHDEAAWAARVEPMLRWLYGPAPAPR